MSRLLPITVGAIQIGLAGLATYILCSANTLNEVALFLSH
jgi:hypothetical protein